MRDSEGRFVKGSNPPKHKINCKCTKCGGPSPFKGKKNPKISGKNHWNWKGKNVGYSGIHIWLLKKYGLPNRCDECKTTKSKRYEWANISGKYKRDIRDFKRLCASCHKLYDYKLGRLKAPKTAFKKGERPSPKTEFKKGHIPWNRGLRYKMSDIMK